MSLNSEGKVLAIGESNCKIPEIIIIDISNVTKHSVI
jgi:hypothetical protein